MTQLPAVASGTPNHHFLRKDMQNMKRREFVISSALGSAGLLAGNPLSLAMHATRESRKSAGTRKILIAGGGFNTPFIRYMASLTGKTRPRLCYLPTASADNPAGDIRWFEDCAPVNVEPFVQNSFISSYRQTQGWEEVLLSMDGIVASGGNTLNQQAIWKAQGIDAILREAWDRGIVLAARAPDRCAGSRKERPTPGPRSSRRSSVSAS